MRDLRIERVINKIINKHKLAKDQRIISYSFLGWLKYLFLYNSINL